jgi:hypothetical protein
MEQARLRILGVAFLSTNLKVKEAFKRAVIRCGFIV